MNVSEAKLSVTPENTSSPDKSQNQSPHIVDPQAIDKMDDDGVAQLLSDCFHCGMADYSANPVGNPFGDAMLSDLSNPLVEF